MPSGYKLVPTTSNIVLNVILRYICGFLYFLYNTSYELCFSHITVKPTFKLSIPVSILMHNLEALFMKVAA